MNIGRGLLVSLVLVLGVSTGAAGCPLSPPHMSRHCTPARPLPHQARCKRGRRRCGQGPCCGLCSVCEGVACARRAGAMMKGISVAEFGGPDVMKLVDIAMPEAKEGEVLVKVYAAGEPQSACVWPTAPICCQHAPCCQYAPMYGVATCGYAPAFGCADGHVLPASYTELICRNQPRGDVQARGDVCQALASCASVHSRYTCSHAQHVVACIVTSIRSVAKRP